MFPFPFNFSSPLWTTIPAPVSNLLSPTASVPHWPCPPFGPRCPCPPLGPRCPCSLYAPIASVPLSCLHFPCPPFGPHFCPLVVPDWSWLAYSSSSSITVPAAAAPAAVPAQAAPACTRNHDNHGYHTVLSFAAYSVWTYTGTVFVHVGFVEKGMWLYVLYGMPILSTVWRSTRRFCISLLSFKCFSFFGLSFRVCWYACS